MSKQTKDPFVLAKTKFYYWSCDACEHADQERVFSTEYTTTKRAERYAREHMKTCRHVKAYGIISFQIWRTETVTEHMTSGRAE